MFRATIMFGLTAGAYYKNVPTNFWTVFSSSVLSAGESSSGCASWGTVDPYFGAVNWCGKYCDLVVVGCWNLWSASLT